MTFFSKTRYLLLLFDSFKKKATDIGSRKEMIAGWCRQIEKVGEVETYLAGREEILYMMIKRPPAHQFCLARLEITSSSIADILVSDFVAYFPDCIVSPINMVHPFKIAQRSHYSHFCQLAILKSCNTCCELLSGWVIYIPENIVPKFCWESFKVHFSRFTLRLNVE